MSEAVHGIHFAERQLHDMAQLLRGMPPSEIKAYERIVDEWIGALKHEVDLIRLRVHFTFDPHIGGSEAAPALPTNLAFSVLSWDGASPIEDET